MAPVGRLIRVKRRVARRAYLSPFTFEAVDRNHTFQVVGPQTTFAKRVKRF